MPKFWPRPQRFGLGLGLVALASASTSRFWPRLTPLIIANSFLTCSWSDGHSMQRTTYRYWWKVLTAAVPSSSQNDRVWYTVCFPWHDQETACCEKTPWTWNTFRQSITLRGHIEHSLLNLLIALILSTTCHLVSYICRETASVRLRSYLGCYRRGSPSVSVWDHRGSFLPG